MKNLSIILIFSISFCACSKEDNNENPPVIKRNTVTYTSPFSGQTYTVTEANSKVVNNSTTYVDTKIEASNGFSNFYLDVVGDTLPFTISIHIPHGPVGGNGPTGWYTTQSQYGGTIKISDKFSDIHAMPITGDSIFVTTADSAKIIGNYVLHVQQGNQDRRVVGTFTINEPAQ